MADDFKDLIVLKRLSKTLNELPLSRRAWALNYLHLQVEDAHQEKIGIALKEYQAKTELDGSEPAAVL